MAKLANQQKAITALLTTDTIAKAADQAGLSQETIYRYLRDPLFLAEYRATRRDLMESTVGRLQNATDQAVHTLRRNMQCGTPGAEIRAAQVILENASKGIELTEIVERLEALEQCTEASKPGFKNLR